MEALCDQGYQVSLETSGACSTEEVDPRVQVILDVKCPGSEMADRHDWSNMKRLRSRDQVKFVLSNRRDYDYAVDVCRRHHLFNAPQEILFSPSFEELEPRKLVEWILMDKLPVRLSMQIHKWIWEPEKQGV
jgi:7-carboxy-7-deazaguanine synthase